MANWDQKSLADLFPAGVQALLTTANTVASSVGTLVNAVGTVANVISAFVVDYVDPIEAATTAFIAEVENFVNDLKTTGVYLLVLPPPKSDGVSRGTDKFMSEVVDQFYDIGDPNRPVFSDSALIGGVVVLAGAPNLLALKEIANSMGNVFGLKDFQDLKRILDTPPITSTTLTARLRPALALQRIPVTNTDNFLPEGGAILIDNEIIEYVEAKPDAFLGCRVSATHDVGARVLTSALGYVGESPDFRRLKVLDLFPTLGELLNRLDGFSRRLLAAPKASAAAHKFSQLLLDKASDLQSIASEMNATLTNLINDFNTSPISVLKISEGLGGNRRFINEMLTATNKPNFSGDAKTCGLLVLGGAGTMQVLERFF